MGKPFLKITKRFPLVGKPFLKITKHFPLVGKPFCSFTKRYLECISFPLSLCRRGVRL
jgi:hypothetical protein